MWIIHFVGMPKSGKTEVAKGLLDLLSPFLRSINVGVNYIELSSIVEKYYDAAKIDKRMTSLQYKGEAPAELLETYYKALKPLAVNIVVGAREPIFFDTMKYVEWLGKDLPDSMYQIIVKVMASKTQRATRADAKAFEKEEASETSYGLPDTLDKVWQCTINNESASDLAEAPVQVLKYILSHVQLSSVKKE